MNKNFNVKNLAAETADAYSAGSYNSWIAVVRLLDNRGFNRFEAEAILRSKHTRWARDEFGEGSRKSNTAGTLAKYLDRHKIVPHCAEVNSLVMGTFDGSVENCPNLHLELDEIGIPCRRGLPVLGDGKTTILVPLGTPACCDPTTETYACM